MRFDRKHAAITVLTSKDETRGHLTHCELECPAWPNGLGRDGRLLATDGHRLMVLPVKLDEHDAPGPVTAEAIVAAAKVAKAARRDEAVVVCNGTQEVPGGPTFQRPTREGKYPPVDQVVPKYDEPGKGGVVQLGLNARYLAEIAKALGSEIVTLTVKFEPTGRTLEPIVVNAADADGFAVLMPCRV